MVMVGEVIVEALNQYIEKEREFRGIQTNRHLILHQSSDNLKFGNLKKVSWKVYYKGKTNAILVEIGASCKTNKVDYQRDLGIKLQVSLYQVLFKEYNLERIINGEDI